MDRNVTSEMLKILHYMNEMECEELSMKTKDQEMTVLLTDCEKYDSIEVWQECATSIPPEEGARAGDSIIPALLNIVPYDTIVEWKTKMGEWHTNMAHDITREMTDSMPENPRIVYYPALGSITIGGV